MSSSPRDLWRVGFWCFGTLTLPVEVCQNFTDLQLAKISKHGNIMTGHCCSELDNDPLNGFRDNLSLRHDW